MKKFIAIAMILTSCHKINARTMTPYGRIGEIKDQQSRAVALRVLCGKKVWSGSGVIFDDDLILTAKHVVTCNNKTRAVMICDRVGRCTTASRAATSGSHDIALLKSTRKFDVKRQRVSEFTGKTLCLSPGMPTRVRTCGKLVRNSGGTILHTTRVYAGNSGSGLYSRDGALVGIISGTYKHDNTDSFGGLSVNVSKFLPILEEMLK